MKRKNGITLVALIVTIIVLIILSTVTVNLIIDTNLIERVASAKEPNEIESIRERLELVKSSMYVDNKGRSSIDRYLETLEKEKIEPYIVTRTEKMTEEVAIVEVDNKYSYTITFKNNIEIEYEGKLGEFEREEQKIEIVITGENTQANFPIVLEATVTDNEKEVTSGKWILNKESEEIGTQESLYAETINGIENINIELNEADTYYLHVLTTDKYGRKKETIKGPITITAKYHTHKGSSSAVGGCYGNCTGTRNVKCGCYNSEDLYWPSWSGSPLCGKCGHNSWAHDGNDDNYICPQVVGTETYTYIDLVCGKNASTIDSYEVSY